MTTLHACALGGDVGLSLSRNAREATTLDACAIGGDVGLSLSRNAWEATTLHACALGGDVGTHACGLSGALGGALGRLRR
jgi:hypothetical protein